MVTAGSFLLQEDWETNSNLEAANSALKCSEDHGILLNKWHYIHYWCLFHLELNIKELKLRLIYVVFNKVLLYFLHIKNICADRFLSHFYFSQVLSYMLFHFFLYYIDHHHQVVPLRMPYLDYVNNLNENHIVFSRLAI